MDFVKKKLQDRGQRRRNSGDLRERRFDESFGQRSAADAHSFAKFWSERWRQQQQQHRRRWRQDKEEARQEILLKIYFFSSKKSFCE